MRPQASPSEMNLSFLLTKWDSFPLAPAGATPDTAGCLPWAPPQPRFPHSPAHSLGFLAWHCPAIPSGGAVAPHLCPPTTYLYSKPQTPLPPHPSRPGGPLHHRCTRPVPGPRPSASQRAQAEQMKAAALAWASQPLVAVLLCQCAPPPVSFLVTQQSLLRTDSMPGITPDAGGRVEETDRFWAHHSLGPSAGNPACFPFGRKGPQRCASSYRNV